MFLVFKARRFQRDPSNKKLRADLLRAGAKAVPHLLPLLDRKQFAPHYALTELLAEIGDHRAIEPLVQALMGTDHHLCSIAARGLAKMNWQPAGGELDESQAAQQRAALAFFTERIPEGEGAIPFLVDVLKRKNQFIVPLWQRAMRYLNELKDERLLTSLISILETGQWGQEPDDFAVLVANFRDGRAVYALVKVYFRVKSGDARKEIIKGLRPFAERGGREVLARFKERDTVRVDSDSGRGMFWSREVLACFKETSTIVKFLLELGCIGLVPMSMLSELAREFVDSIHSGRGSLMREAFAAAGPCAGDAFLQGLMAVGDGSWNGEVPSRAAAIFDELGFQAEGVEQRVLLALARRDYDAIGRQGPVYFAIVNTEKGLMTSLHAERLEHQLLRNAITVDPLGRLISILSDKNTVFYLMREAIEILTRILRVGSNGITTDLLSAIGELPDTIDARNIQPHQSLEEMYDAREQGHMGEPFDPVAHFDFRACKELAEAAMVQPTGKNLKSQI